MYMNIKVIIAAGGGHFSPALALLTNKKYAMEALIAGRKYSLEGDSAISLEYKVAKSLGVPFRSITTGRLQRRWTRYTLFSLMKLPIGFIQSLFIIKQFKPDAVLAFGGYVSLPVAFASFLLRIPVVVHEQTLGAGLANRIIGLFAKKICISWEQSRKFFPREKTILTGNMVRSFSFIKDNNLLPEEENNLPLVYITGGSLGSHALNILIEGCVKRLLEKYIVVHQTGDAQEYRDYDKLVKLRETLGDFKSRYVISKFVPPQHVGSVLKKADIVIGRSGINTVTELILFRKPSIMVPLSFAQNNEQRKNALFLKDLGLAEVLEQKDATSDKLYELISKMLSQKDKYRLKRNDFEKIQSKASERFMNVVWNVVKK